MIYSSVREERVTCGLQAEPRDRPLSLEIYQDELWSACAGQSIKLTHDRGQSRHISTVYNMHDFFFFSLTWVSGPPCAHLN